METYDENCVHGVVIGYPVSGMHSIAAMERVDARRPSTRSRVSPVIHRRMAGWLRKWNICISKPVVQNALQIQNEDLSINDENGN